jgi:hypothetical protein
VSVFGLNSEQIDDLWPHFGHHIERLERETQLVLAEAIRKDLKSARKQLWGYQDGPVVTGVAITEIYETPRGKCCEVHGACGTESSRGQIEQIMAAIEAWAKDIGCTRVRFGGRHGLKRKLKGFAEVGIILEKEI